MGIAALWIFIFHFAPYITFSNTYLNYVSFYFKSAGFTGVDIFLLVSSFGLVQSFVKKPVSDIRSYGKYVKTRLLRIYSVYLPVLIVIALVDKIGVVQFIKYLFFITQFGEDSWTFLWYVPCIVVFYLLAPFYWNLYRKISNRQLFTVLVISAYVGALFLLQDYIRFDLFLMTNRIPVFLLGFCFGHAYSEKKAFPKTEIIIWISLFCIGLIRSFFLNRDTDIFLIPLENALVNVMLAPGLVIIIAAFASLISKCRIGAPVSKAFSFLGQRSLEFYCIQEWLFAKLAFLGKYSFFVLLLFLICVAVSELFFLLAKCIKKVFVKG